MPSNDTEQNQNQNRGKQAMAEESSSVPQPPPQGGDRLQVLKKLYSNGFGIVFETVVTLHRCELSSLTESEQKAEVNGSQSASDQQWQTIDYGIPAVTAEGGSLHLHICDIASGDTTNKFMLQADSYYSELGTHFHAFVDCTQSQETDKVYCFGISTPDEAVAKKILTVVKRIVPLSDEQSLSSELGGPLPKRGRFVNDGESNAPADDKGMTSEPKDVLEAGDEDEADGRVEADVGSDEDDTDSALLRLRQGVKRRHRSQKKTHPLISEPKEFRHIAHVGQDTSVSIMTKAMSMDISQSPDISVSSSLETMSVVSSIEPGTEETTSFVEVPKEDLPMLPPPPVPPPPPPVVKPPAPVVLGKKSNKSGTLRQSQPQNPAISLEEILKKRGTLRPVSGSKIVPEPPPKPDRSKLFSEINTFDRNTLKHIDHQNYHDTTDVDDPNCLQSILKASLLKMRDRLSTNFCQVGNINSEGDEDGFGDECDGPLFAED